MGDTSPRRRKLEEWQRQRALQEGGSSSGGGGSGGAKATPMARAGSVASIDFSKRDRVQAGPTSVTVVSRGGTSASGDPRSRSVLAISQPDDVGANDPERQRFQSFDSSRLISRKPVRTVASLQVPTTPSSSSNSSAASTGSTGAAASVTRLLPDGVPSNSSAEIARASLRQAFAQRRQSMASLPLSASTPVVATTPGAGGSAIASGGSGSKTQVTSAAELRAELQKISSRGGSFIDMSLVNRAQQSGSISRPVVQGAKGRMSLAKQQSMSVLPSPSARGFDSADKRPVPAPASGSSTSASLQPSTITPKNSKHLAGLVGPDSTARRKAASHIIRPTSSSLSRPITPSELSAGATRPVVAAAAQPPVSSPVSPVLDRDFASESLRFDGPSKGTSAGTNTAAAAVVAAAAPIVAPTIITAQTPTTSFSIAHKPAASKAQTSAATTPAPSSVSSVAPPLSGASLVAVTRELQLLHTRLLQWCFVNARSERCFLQREANAEKAMLAAWEEVERLQQRVSDIEQRVERATFTMQLDQQIAALAEELPQLQQAMDQIEARYGTLATSVFNTTHGMPIDGVKLDTDRMVASLKTSEALFTNLNDSIGSSAMQVQQLAQLLDEVATLSKEEAHELQTGQELLSKIEELEQQERSLRIQAIQLDRLQARGGVITQ